MSRDAAGATPPMDGTVYTIDAGAGGMRAHEAERFWPRLMAGEITDAGLVTFMRMTGDFPHWEMHPRGDELFILHSGAIEIDLEAPDGAKRTIRLNARKTFLIERGHWHFARTIEPGDLTVITFGEGTEHRPA